jgi:hypothetical protein
MDFNKMFKNVKESFLSPTKTAKKLVGKVSFSEGVITSLTIGAITSAISAILAAIIMLIEGKPGPLQALPASGLLFFILFFILGVLIIVLIATIASLVVAIIDFGIVWFAGKLLGGKAKFGEFYGPLIYSTAALSLLYAVILPFMYVGGIITVFLVELILLAVGIKALANQVIFTKEAHKISTVRAAIAVLCPVVLIVLLIIVLVVIAMSYPYPINPPYVYGSCKFLEGMDCVSYKLHATTSELDLSINQSTGHTINITGVTCTENTSSPSDYIDSTNISNYKSDPITVTSGSIENISESGTSHVVICTDANGNLPDDTDWGALYIGTIYIKYTELDTNITKVYVGNLQAHYLH